MQDNTKCATALLELRDSIKKELADEDTAAKMYSDMAAKFNSLEETRNANILLLIAGQELAHRVILEGVVDYISEKCEG